MQILGFLCLEKGPQRARNRPKGRFRLSLNNLLPRNRAFGYRRVRPLIGIAPIPNGGRRCPGIGRVTIAVVIATVIGSRC